MTTLIDALKKRIDDHIMKIWREGAEVRCCVKCGFCSACCQQGTDDEVHEHQEDIHDIQGLSEMIDKLIDTYEKELLKGHK
jgi:Zn ribbon nucleic-acid-binding protein